MPVQGLREGLAQAGLVEGAREVDLDVDRFRFLLLEAVPGHLVHHRERDAGRRGHTGSVLSGAGSRRLTRPANRPINASS